MEAVATYSAGSADIDQLSEHLPTAWNRLLVDDKRRHEVAVMLGADPNTWKPSAKPPFEFFSTAGVDAQSVVVTVLIWAGSDVFLGAITDLARDEVKKHMKRLWEMLEPGFRLTFDTRDALGPPKPPASDTDSESDA